MIFKFLEKRKIKKLNDEIELIIFSIEYKAKKLMESNLIEEKQRLKKELIEEGEALKNYRDKLRKSEEEIWRKLTRRRFKKGGKITLYYNERLYRVHAVGFERSNFTYDESVKIATTFSKIIGMRIYLIGVTENEWFIEFSL